MRREHLGLWAACTIFLALRAAILFTDFDSVAMTSYELYPMGTLPSILLEGGIAIPLTSYYDNAGGQLVTGLAAVPMYLLLGHTYLALKLVPLLSGLGALIVLWCLLRAAFGTRAAWWGALLFALAPATLVKYSLKASGNHYENLFFTLLATWTLWRAHDGGRRAPRLWLAGWAMGLALTVFLGAMIPIGLLACVHLGLCGWRRALRDLAHLVPGGLLGALPLIALNLWANRPSGAKFLAAKFGGSGAGLDLARVARRCIEFFTVHLPDSMTYPRFAGLPGSVAGALFLACFGVALAAVVPEGARATARLLRGALGGGVLEAQPRVLARLQSFVLVPLVLYLPLTALAYGLSDLRMGGYRPPLEDGGYRYYLPTLTFGCLLIGVVAARWLARPERRVAGRMLALAALACGAFDLALIEPSLERAGRGSHYEGHYMKQVARNLIAPSQARSNEWIRARVAEFPPVYAARIAEGLGCYGAMAPGLALLAEAPGPSQIAGAWPEPWRADLLRGVGAHLRLAAHDAQRRSRILQWCATLPESDPAAAHEVLAGMALEWEVLTATQTRADHEFTLGLLNDLPAALQPDLARGLGIAAGRALRREIASDALCVAELWPRLPEALHLEFEDGLGLGLADGARQAGWPATLALDPRRAARVLAALDRRLRGLFGGAAAEQRARVGSELPPELRAAWDALG